MARTRKTHRPRDASATREALLDAASLVFAEQGFAGARVDEISTRAGVNKALIYAYYGDKTGIYRAVLAAHLHECADSGFSRGVAAEAGPRRALEDIVRRYIRLLIKDRPFARLLAWDLLSNGKGGRDIILESSGPLLELISELVNRGRATGELRGSTEPRHFRSALFSIGVGYALQHSVMTLGRERSGQLRTDEQFVEYVCRLLLESESARERRTA
jgi:TetR/AcrR family transcriptional regulator